MLQPFQFSPDSSPFRSLRRKERIITRSKTRSKITPNMISRYLHTQVSIYLSSLRNSPLSMLFKQQNYHGEESRLKKGRGKGEESCCFYFCLAGVFVESGLSGHLSINLSIDLRREDSFCLSRLNLWVWVTGYVSSHVAFRLFKSVRLSIYLSTLF